MKITDIQFRAVQIKLKEPIKLAFGVFHHSACVLVRITTDEGLIGFGEADPSPFVTGETTESVCALLALFREALLGINPLAVDQVHAVMDGIVSGNGSAKCAIDLALYDIRGKVMGKPVYQLLGGGSGIVQNDVTITIGDPEEMAREAKHCVEDRGYRILKIKAGLNLKEDVRALSLIRAAVGDHIRIRVDANQGYSFSNAIAALDAFRELGVEAVEQCRPAWDFEGAAEVRRKARGIQVMLDESIHSPHDAMRACREGAADILNIKLMKCGGLYPAEQINAIAQASGLTCMVGCMVETRLSITAGLSLVAAKRNITDADCDGFMCFDESQIGVTGGFTMERDNFILSEKPGFGVEVDF